MVKKIIKINTYYPSSKICSCCGEKNEELEDLSIREWICPYCGATLDRDVNVATNILNEGMKIIENK